MAIPKHLRLEFVTPARAIVHEDVDEVELPGEDGYFGVLPGHAALLAALKTGQLWYRKGPERTYAFVDGGFAEVVAERVTVLAKVAERADEIDLSRAEASRRRAEEILAKTSTVDFETHEARSALLRAITRIQISRHARPRT